MLQKTKICRLCEREKPIEKFGFSGSKGRLSLCYACMASRQRAKLRLELLEAFGWKCNCCNESHPQVLTLEHIKGHEHGAAFRHKHRMAFIQSYVELSKAKKSGWDKAQYELLCISCNWEKGKFGACHHRSGVTPEEVIAKLRKAANFKCGFSPNSVGRKFVKGHDGRRPHERPHTEMVQ